MMQRSHAIKRIHKRDLHGHGKEGVFTKNKTVGEVLAEQYCGIIV